MINRIWIPILALAIAAPAHAQQSPGEAAVDPDFGGSSVPAAVSTAISYKQQCYSIPTESASANILLPVKNRPIHLMATNNTAGYEGVAEATIVHSSGGFFQWVAVDYSSGAVSKGSSNTAFTIIFATDYEGSVTLELKNASTLYIINMEPITQNVCLTMTW
jgi:hypothetical protein